MKTNTLVAGIGALALAVILPVAAVSAQPAPAAAPPMAMPAQPAPAQPAPPAMTGQPGQPMPMGQMGGMGGQQPGRPPMPTMPPNFPAMMGAVPPGIEVGQQYGFTVQGSSTEIAGTLTKMEGIWLRVQAKNGDEYSINARDIAVVHYIK